MNTSIDPYNYRQYLKEYLNADHQYMSVSAIEQLPMDFKEIIGSDSVLFIRYFCELPDMNHAIYDYPGLWEISTKNNFNHRRDFQVSHFQGYNPLLGTGKRIPHDTGGMISGVPGLLLKALQKFKKGEKRQALAFLGSACHHIQDVVTFPDQQVLHRRPMTGFTHIAIPTYKPKRLFKNEEQIKEAVTELLDRCQKLMSTQAQKIRAVLRSGDQEGSRNHLHEACDLLGAELTADLLYTMLFFYQPPEKESSTHYEDFTDIDPEGLPKGYFIDRENGPVYQGYAGVEGHLHRGFHLQKTPGLQLRLSSSGNQEISWLQSIIDALCLTPGQDYRFTYTACGQDISGQNGVRLHLFNKAWESEQTIDLPTGLLEGIEERALDIKCPENIIAARIEFYSANNQGIILLDNWQLAPISSENESSSSFSTGKHQQKSIKNEEKIFDILLKLQPVQNSYYIKDLSSYEQQNQPVTSVKGGTPECIAKESELLFNGSSDFVEIAWHPQFAPLQPKGDLIIEFDFMPLDNNRGDLIMSAYCAKTPLSGWRLYLNQGFMAVALYDGADNSFEFTFKDAPVQLNNWQKATLKITPDNEFTLTYASKKAVKKAPFKRVYSNAGHFFGADFGVENFFKGSMKNIVFKTEF